jgi:hypothetical protein
LRARFYDPVTASFLSVDPALAQTGSPYAYASGNPLQLTDPLGLWSLKGAWNSVKSAASATGNWIVDNKGMLIGAAAGILVTAGCLAITAGAGSIACAALGGAVGGMVTYGIDTPKECWTAGGFFVSGAIGGIIGGVTMGAGKALAPLASKAFDAVASKASPAIRNVISKTVTALKPRASAEPEITRVFRVEGPGNARLNIDPGGNVGISGDKTMFLNFGDEARAQQFLAQRLSQGFEGTSIKSFDVPTSYVNDLASRAVPESMAKTASAFQVDVTKTAGSYGLRSSEFPSLMCAIIPGSAC